ncbi:MAG: hypothetical protein ACFFBK_07440 [Promethearchaeota archaeon]
MNNVDEKSAYPYITKFKKEPFKTFIITKRREIRSFYYSEYNRLTEFYKFYNHNLLNDLSINLENIFWFVLLRKFLKEDKKEKRDELFNFIKKCEVLQNEQLGFRVSPHSEEIPDIYSTYLALSCLKTLGFLKEYLVSKDHDQIKVEIKNFVLSLKKGNKFLHCQDKECAICKEISPARTLYYVMEIFTLLGIDVRVNGDQFHSYLGDKKRDFSLIFRLICLKILDLEFEVKEKEIQFLQQLQNEDGGFSFNEIDEINATFWVGYVLELYSWFIDYSPLRTYSFINKKLNEALKTQDDWNSEKLNKASKLIILLSFVWKKFIDEIERILFKQLEKEKYIDLNRLKTTFGFTDQIEEIISYINLSYNFKLKFIDNEKEFKNYIRNFSHGKQEFFQNFYDKLNNNSVISLTGLFKQYKTLNFEQLRLKEEIFPIIRDMVKNNLFKGKIRKKKTFLGFKTKYLFYLDNHLKKIIVSNIDINAEDIYQEKERLEDIRNDIYNMTLKLKNVSQQIKEEINSYLIINEIDYAKERLKFALRNALMEADFLNENIENSFNQALKYINIQANLGTEISQWSKRYALLQKKLGEIDLYLKNKINEKEQLRNLKNILDNLKEKLIVIDEDLIKKMDAFRTSFNEKLETGFDNAKFNSLIQDLDQISQKVRKYDKIIYKVSQQFISKEKKIVKSHKKVIANWIRIKEKFDNEFKFYTDGFQFFNINLQKIANINNQLNTDLEDIEEKANIKIRSNEFQDAFNIIKKESDALLNQRIIEIKELKSSIKQELKSKQKLYLLFRYLQDKLESLEINIIDVIANQTKNIKDKILEERNKSRIEDFDNFVSQEIIRIKSKLNGIKSNLTNLNLLKIEDVNKEFDILQADFNKSKKKFSKNLSECSKIIEDFNEKSKLTIIQWEKFNDFFNNEIPAIKEDYINRIISNEINKLTIEKKTNIIKLTDLKNETKLSCKILINKLKDMINISKINAELNEQDKTVLVYTDSYYLNKELQNYIENNLLKLNRERIGKILALYDSSIRNRTLNTNMLEIKNRIEDLRIFEDIIPQQFIEKVKELQINQEREDFNEVKKKFESILKNNRIAINKIKNNLEFFIKVQNFINQQFNTLNAELNQFFTKIFKAIEDADNYLKIQETFEYKKQFFNENFKQSQIKIEEKINSLLIKIVDSRNLESEIRELYVKAKNNFLEEYDNKIQKINDRIVSLKNESFREHITTLINDSKLYLSQLLGNLERKVEDNIEIKEFKKSNVIIQKRAKSIEMEIKEINKKIETSIKDLKKKSINFSQISTFILEDYNKFISEYSEILTEKVKAMERLIVKSYIEMTIKAVSNEYLTIGFLNNELKIKKKNIQDHLLFLISSGDLNGKYDPRFGIYYENPEILEELDATELEVIKSTNYKVSMMLRHLKNFASQYGSIIAFFASIITISYYLFLFSGNNPAVIALPIIAVILILSLYFLRKEKEEKIK